jgi:penicillin amidase
MTPRTFPVVCLLLLSAASTTLAQGIAPQSGVRIDWDTYGVPHITGATDEDAYFGLGYAVAQDRLFQLYYTKIIYEGRTAEFFGAGPGDVNIQHDRKARQIGWARHADTVIRSLDAESRGLLEAYAAGVNAYATQSNVQLHPLFATYGVPLVRWNARDCIGAWVRLGRHFAGFANNEAKARHQVADMFAAGASRDEIMTAILGDAMCVDRHAVVKQSDVAPGRRRAMAEFARRFGVAQHQGCTLGTYVPNFSQALAVSGARTTSGRAVLLGEPRVNVYFPNIFYEWHVKGATFDVRGMGVAGSPNLLVGSSPTLAWSPTAMGLDQADLFKLETDAAHPGQYRLDGRWLSYTVDAQETILVRNGNPVTETYRETVWGPVVSAPVINDVRPGEVYAVKAVPLTIPGRDAVPGFVSMYRADTIRAFSTALEGWTWPSVNLVYASSAGAVGYTAVGAAPVRAAGASLAGTLALDGNDSANDWQGFVPHTLVPSVINPAAGAVCSANNLPIGSWYPLRSIYPGLGSGTRARRLGELLDSQRVFTEADVRGFHLDRVNPNTRDVVSLGLVLRDRMGVRLSAQARAALDHLEGWLQSGATMDRSHGGVAIAHRVRGTLRRGVDGDIVDTYGAGQTGMTNFLEERMRGLRMVPALLPTREEAGVLEAMLEAALDTLLVREPRLRGASSAELRDWYVANELTGVLPRWTSLGMSEPLERGDVAYGPLITSAKSTNLSQSADSYTQFVVLGAPDGAQSMLAFGQSELDASPHSRDQQRLWERGLLKASPTSAAGLLRLGVERSILLRR